MSSVFNIVGRLQENYRKTNKPITKLHITKADYSALNDGNHGFKDYPVTKFRTANIIVRDDIKKSYFS